MYHRHITPPNHSTTQNSHSTYHSPLHSLEPKLTTISRSPSSYNTIPSFKIPKKTPTDFWLLPKAPPPTLPSNPTPHLNSMGNTTSQTPQSHIPWRERETEIDVDIRIEVDMEFGKSDEIRWGGMRFTRCGYGYGMYSRRWIWICLCDSFYVWCFWRSLVWCRLLEWRLVVFAIFDASWSLTQ